MTCCLKVSESQILKNLKLTFEQKIYSHLTLVFKTPPLRSRLSITRVYSFFDFLISKQNYYFWITVQCAHEALILLQLAINISIKFSQQIPNSQEDVVTKKVHCCCSFKSKYRSISYIIIAGRPYHHLVLKLELKRKKNPKDYFLIR